MQLQQHCLVLQLQRCQQLARWHQHYQQPAQMLLR
jgi:hypothetical protein